MTMFCGVCTIAQAQIRVAVIDPFGRGIPDATISVWSDSVEIAKRSSDRAGLATFTTKDLGGAISVVAKRIGFRPRATSVVTGRHELTITLDPIDAPLPEMTTYAVRRLCPNTDAPNARAFWDSVRRRYRRLSPRDGLSMTMYAIREEVPASRVGEIDEARLVEAAYTVWGIARAGSLGRTERKGYAERLSDRPAGAYMESLFFAWAYAPLWRDQLDHLIADDFTARHTISVDTVGPTYRISFCGRASKVPHLQGAIEVSADSAILHMSVRFMTPQPDEDAGAEIDFVVPSTLADGVNLVPARSVFWRRLMGRPGWYYQEAASYTRWATAPYCPAAQSEDPACRPPN